MKHAGFPPSDGKGGTVIVVGAGIGGLCAALRLAHAGLNVSVLERHGAPGGKMRQVGGVDAGPTVLTMRDVFDTLFADVGTRTEDHVSLIPQSVLARHWWPDGSTLDLHADRARNTEAIAKLAGPREARAFEAFSKRARTLFDGFDAPVMRNPAPQFNQLASLAFRQPALFRAMAPTKTLAALLQGTFSDPRLRQLFGRYATYVGGSPYKSPALLSLIWEAEAAGVWCVRGGMHALAKAIAQLAKDKGAEFRYSCHASRILTDSSGVTGVALEDGTVLPTDHVVFNGDPRALASGLLGRETQGVAAASAKTPRSLSANVWSFAANATGLDLAHHNVFFCADPQREFSDIENGRLPSDPTLYLCAEDRGQGTPPPATERFEIIANAPPLTRRTPQPEDPETCRQQTFQTLERFGLSMDPWPGPGCLTTPADFDRLFPGSSGSLYGQSPHGMTAALDRPVATTAIPGLVLAGGGVHPGAGVPMAAISGGHAAAAILRGPTSTSRSRQTAMPGGTSTA
ncbi:1-hydroxycarotenoid 3,4-desaturase CrtD [Thalassococcus sp. BH17M4-6]|uniref:1-hydroxycarotenoid 3,4-desaturase CrtD n=1 Tax=Thalassococcus sp. BH17M4-6 TaxID=3413148 RepID=UPI003BBB34C4